MTGKSTCLQKLTKSIGKFEPAMKWRSAKVFEHRHDRETPLLFVVGNWYDIEIGTVWFRGNCSDAGSHSRFARESSFVSVRVIRRTTLVLSLVLTASKTRGV